MSTTYIENEIINIKAQLYEDMHLFTSLNKKNTELEAKIQNLETQNQKFERIFQTFEVFLQKSTELMEVMIPSVQRSTYDKKNEESKSPDNMRFNYLSKKDFLTSEDNNMDDLLKQKQELRRQINLDHSSDSKSITDDKSDFESYLKKELDPNIFSDHKNYYNEVNQIFRPLNNMDKTE